MKLIKFHETGGTFRLVTNPDGREKVRLSVEQSGQNNYDDDANSSNLDNVQGID